MNALRIFSMILADKTAAISELPDERVSVEAKTLLAQKGSGNTV
jgi:hypothetical protein